jgi:hypothetical protein
LYDKEELLVIYIDIDGVMTHTVNTLQKITGMNIDPILTEYDFRSGQFTPDAEKQIIEAVSDPNGWAKTCSPNVPLMDALDEFDGDYTFLTVRPESCKVETERWLFLYGFGGRSVIYAKDSIMGNGLLIDDKPETAYLGAQAGKEVYLYVNQSLQFRNEIEKYNITKFVTDDLLWWVLKRQI